MVGVVPRGGSRNIVGVVPRGGSRTGDRWRRVRDCHTIGFATTIIARAVLDPSFSTSSHRFTRRILPLQFLLYWPSK